MKNRPGEKIKLASIDELLGVVNEESAMEIEINKIHATSFFFNDFPRCKFLIRKFFPDLYFIHPNRKRIDSLALIGKPTVDSMCTDRNQHTEADDPRYG